MFYCGGTIAGPFYEYKDYINFIERKENYVSIPSTIIPTLKRIFNALCKNKLNLYMVFALVILSILLVSE
jgi:hypothetical protein